MIAEHLPRIDIHRLASSQRQRGRLTLKGGLRVRYGLDIEQGQMGLGLQGQTLYPYDLRKDASHRYSVRCTECGNQYQILYWSPHAERMDWPAACRCCVGATWLAQHYSRANVPGHRADIRAGLYQPVIDGINGGDYVAARIAMEKEGVVPDHRRIFTLPDGQKRRWAYLKKDSQE